MDEEAVPKYGMLGWGKRELKFLGWLIAIPFSASLVFLLVLLIQTFSGFDMSLISDENESLNWSKMGLFWISAYLPTMYLFSRFSLLYPSTAVDENIVWDGLGTFPGITDGVYLL